MVTGRRFPATFLPPQANLVPTFSTYWNFLFQLVGELVPANGTASHFLLFQNISIPLPKTNEPGYTRRTNSPSRGVLVSSKEPIGIGRIAYGRKLPSLRWCWLLWLWWCGWQASGNHWRIQTLMKKVGVHLLQAGRFERKGINLRIH